MSNSQFIQIMAAIAALEEKVNTAVAAMKDAASKAFTEAQAARNDVKHLPCQIDKSKTECISLPVLLEAGTHG